MTSRPALFAGVCALAFACGATLAATPAKPAAKAAPAKAAAPAKDAPLPEASADQQKAAELVFYGDYDCEFNQTVNIQADPKHLFYVNVKHGKGTWVMKPVLSTTGAMRLEDVKGETLMVQIASKSMLLNTKTGQRLVDACVSPRQRELIEAARAMKERAIAAGVPEAPALLSGGSATPSK